MSRVPFGEGEIPSDEKLAEEIGIAPHLVRLALKKAEAAGFIRVIDNGPGRPRTVIALIDEEGEGP